MLTKIKKNNDFGKITQNPATANCSLCGCFNEVVYTAAATPICSDELPCAKRIRQDILLGRKALVILIR